MQTKKTMSTNRQILNKGIKYLAWALPMFFIGPSVIYNAFQNRQNAWHYLVLAVGIAVCFFAVYFMFKGLNTIMKSLFGK
jgi:polyferredoxin